MVDAALKRSVGAKLVIASWPAALALVLLGGALLWHLQAILNFSIWAIRYPYELDYGEGIVWQQMRLMFTGRAYGPIDGFPAIVFHYPPVYHVVTKAVAILFGADELAAGRAVSLAGLCAAAAFASAILFHLLRLEGNRAVAAIGAAVGGLVMLSSWPVLFWTPVMRVDLLALGWTFAGVRFALLALQRPRLIHVAALAFVLAVYTKQSMIAAPAACFGSLLLLRPQTAMRGIATALLLGLPALLALGWATEGGFVSHLFLYNINRFEVGQLSGIATVFSVHSLYVLVAGLGVAEGLRGSAALLRGCRGLRAIRERLAAHPGLERNVMLLAYLVCAALMLLLSAKSGANVNYFIEFLAVLSLFVGLAVARALRANRLHDRHPAASAIVILLVAGQVLLLPTDRFQKLAPCPPRAELDQLSEIVRKATKPVISDDMVLLLRSGADVVWEPAIFAELASRGKFDDKPFIRKIQRQEFEFFVTFRDRGEATFDSRYNSDVADAIERAYPRRQYLAGFTLHLPERP